MSATELNPNHAMTQAVREHWQQLCAVAVAKAGGEIVITVDDMHRIPASMFLTIQELDDGLHLKLVGGEAEAIRLARESGGLPS